MKLERDRQTIARTGRARLADFTRMAWEVVEGPGRPLIWGRHLDAKCEHLEAVTAGQIRNLIITEPPGCTKSRLIGLYWPVWTWLERPDFRWLCLAGDPKLATREALAARRLVLSDWFRDVFPGQVELQPDQNAKDWYETRQGGHRQSLGIGSDITGKKGDGIVVDDANDAEKVTSEAYRNSINDRWDRAIYDRLVDYRTGCRVVTAQRTHPKDLIGHLLETAPEFEHLTIPEQFEPARRVFTSIGWTDWRTEEGEWLRPDRFNAPEKAAAMKRLGSLGWRAKHQQDPRDPGGVLFRKEWLGRRWMRDPQTPDYVILQHGDSLPYRFKFNTAMRHATADGAASDKKSADHNVISVWVMTERGDILWVGCARAQLQIPDQPKLLTATYEAFKYKSIGIEAVASNRALFQAAERLGLPAYPMTPRGRDKLSHAQGALIEAEQGRIWFPGPGEAPEFPLDVVLAELLGFDGKDGGQDDIVDTLSYIVDRKPSIMAAQTQGAAPTVNRQADPMSGPAGGSTRRGAGPGYFGGR